MLLDTSGKTTHILRSLHGPAILEHVRVSKDMMFEEAKAAMLKLLNDLKEEILKTLQETMRESIELSLKTDDNSIPDVPTEFEKKKRFYNELKRNSKELDIHFSFHQWTETSEAWSPTEHL